jgi:hypothetical protein
MHSAYRTLLIFFSRSLYGCILEYTCLRLDNIHIVRAIYRLSVSGLSCALSTFSLALSLSPDSYLSLLSLSSIRVSRPSRVSRLISLPPTSTTQVPRLHHPCDSTITFFYRIQHSHSYSIVIRYGNNSWFKNIMASAISIFLHTADSDHITSLSLADSHKQFYDFSIQINWIRSIQYSALRYI